MSCDKMIRQKETQYDIFTENIWVKQQFWSRFFHRYGLFLFFTKCSTRKFRRKKRAIRSNLSTWTSRQWRFNWTYNLLISICPFQIYYETEICRFVSISSLCCVCFVCLTIYLHHNSHVAPNMVLFGEKKWKNELHVL